VDSNEKAAPDPETPGRRSASSRGSTGSRSRICFRSPSANHRA